MKQPTLYATLHDGKVIGLYDHVILWRAANEPIYFMGECEPRFTHTLYPEVYDLTFDLPYDDNRLAAPDGHLDINGVRFKIDGTRAINGVYEYTATGWPIQVVRTMSTDHTPTFPGWEDVGHEYLDQSDSDYDHET